jgi:hypothetical protein
MVIMSTAPICARNAVPTAIRAPAALPATPLAATLAMRRTIPLAASPTTAPLHIALTLGSLSCPQWMARRVLTCGRMTPALLIFAAGDSNPVAGAPLMISMMLLAPLSVI